MLEKRKEDSESIGKYQGMIMSAIIAAVIVFLAPTLIVTVTGVDCSDPAGGADLSAEDCLFNAPAALGDDIGDGIRELFDILMWAVRLVIIAAIVIGIMMLSVHRGAHVPSWSQPPSERRGFRKPMSPMIRETPK